MEIELWNYYRSSTSYRVRIALHLKGISYTYRPVHLLKNGGEQHQEAFRKLNPLGEVPCLVHGTHIVSQSLAILSYLENLQPNPPIFPQDPYLRAKAWQLAEGINSGIHPLTNLKVLKHLEKNWHLDESEKQNWQQKWIQDGFFAFEKSLQDLSGRYCIGDLVSAADICLIPQLFSARRYGVDLQSFPKIRRIEENCLKLDAFQRAHPERQPDAPKAP
ncbi:MAG: maleylacetoacetate isomerase [Bdellovibrio sp.]